MSLLNFFDLVDGTVGAGRTWLILGKGPSFGRHRSMPRLDFDYVTLGLNHVCRERNVFMTHVIDANVLDEVPGMERKTEYLVMPMHPHFSFKPTARTIEELAEAHPTAKWFRDNGRLLWYNLSTWPKPHGASPVVKAAWFSAEAAVHLLALAGVRKIRTLGVDGGSSYSPEFKDIKPFRGGHSTFDLQKKPIEDVVAKFGLDYGPLAK